MTQSTTPVSERRTALLLAGTQSMFQTASVVLITVGGLIGMKLAPDARLATLPMAVIMLAGTVGMIPAALFMQKHGRRTGFLLGTALGASAGVLAVLAVLWHSFWLFLAANALHGLYSAFAGYYRFAAADAASPGFRPQALSWVVAGGVVAALLGPAIARYGDSMGGTPFVVPLLAMIVLGAVGAFIVTRLQLAAATVANVVVNGAASSADQAARPLAEIFRQPVFIAAITCTTVGFAVMVMVMTATPLAMDICGLPLSSSATVIQWHVLGMFVPSFFTGKLIQRFGVLRVMSVGAACLAGHVLIALSGVEFLHFVSGLTLLGVGWNFMFVGGSTLLTEAYRPSERARAQAAHDFVVYGVTSIASLSAGGLLATLGWQAVNIAVLPALLLACVAMAYLALTRRRALVAAT